MNKVRIDLVPDRAQCSGCGACAAACPRQAITMQTSGHGWVYPAIDHEDCISCGKCIGVCEYRDGAGGQLPMTAYAAVGQCGELVRNSASGGVFASLAMSWVKAGGLVAGAVMDCAGSVQVYHVLSGKEEDIRRMQGSKYVQSDAWRCYHEVAKALRAGKSVLFSGTPCQVAAIKRLTGDPDNLTTIDLICHGVPPVKMLDEYIRLLEKRFHGKVEGFAFRDKSAGKSYCARIELRRGRHTRRLHLRSNELSFYRYFLKGALCRENCYTCPYAKPERVSDLTIGDYWGVERRHATEFAEGIMPRRANWSCMLVNTPKGEALVREHAAQIDKYPSRPEWVAEENQQLCRPTVKPEERDCLLRLYETGGYAAVEDDFIRSAGGKLRYHLRLLKQLLALHRAQKNNEGH